MIIGLFEYTFNDALDVMEGSKSWEFSSKAGKYPIPWYRSGFGAHLGPDLVRICIEKRSVFGPNLVNLGPIWQMAALHFKLFCLVDLIL